MAAGLYRYPPLPYLFVYVTLVWCVWLGFSLPRIDGVNRGRSMDELGGKCLFVCLLINKGVAVYWLWGVLLFCYVPIHPTRTLRY
ncbi:hypothetical protein B0T19DRAFT_423040 [Cercophora scortea]|uniref:Uncharacterized protein n=1 Tax=Cercophora scortea TaxID=314031 RepID=A0AAE0IMR5_9PEZI|nr:hypothetical protein B0T19DRAFT_423040 [Cercophora scortea]